MQTSFQPLVVVRSLLVGCLLLAAAGCDLSEAVPSEWVLAKTSRERLSASVEERAGGERAADFSKQLAAAEDEVSVALESLFGTALAPHWPMGRSGEEAPDLLTKAARSYRAECAHCHGAEGFGNGPSSPNLKPAPWNFSHGVFPRTAPTGGLPKPQAMKEFLARGIDDTSMPPFERLGEEALIGLSGHVLLLTRRAQVERTLVDAWVEGGPGSLDGERALEIYQSIEAGPSPASLESLPNKD
jgi:mono/diheme cytochrome c family protein